MYFLKDDQLYYKDQGHILLLRLATELEEFGKVEQMPKLEGKRMIMYIAPKKKKINNLRQDSVDIKIK